MTLIEHLKYAAQCHPLDAPMELFDIAADEIERLQNESDDLTQRLNGSYQCNANYSHTTNLSYKAEDKPVLIDYYVYMGNIGRYGS